jgi:hypothetical protein
MLAIKRTYLSAFIVLRKVCIIRESTSLQGGTAVGGREREVDIGKEFGTMKYEI